MPDDQPVNKKLGSKEKLLIRAAKKGDLEQVKKAIEKGADVNCGDIVGYHSRITPLMYAAEGGHREVVALLLSAGADVYAQDNTIAGDSQATALHCALQLYSDGQPDLEVIELLLDAGADPNARLAMGDTALDYASSAGYLDAVKLLLKRGGDPNATVGKDGLPALMGASDMGHIGIVETLLKHGADPNGANIRGCTPLMAAAVSKEKELDEDVILGILRLLLQAGARPDDVTKSGRTALSIAVEEAMDSVTDAAFHARFVAVKFLVEEAHANVNLKDEDGRTALDFALLGFDGEPEIRRDGSVVGSELIDYLRQHGATGLTRRRPAP